MIVVAADNTDFVPIFEELVYDTETANGTECFSLSVVDDDILETAENFRIVLQTSSDTIINSDILVTIFDDDGELVLQLRAVSICSDFSLDVAVAFVADSDELRENDEMFAVCVVLNGTTEIDVTVTLFAEQDDQLPLDARAIGMQTTIRITAITFFSLPLFFSYSKAGSDFNQISEQEVVFTLHPQNFGPICRNVTLVNDNISESAESFHIQMSTPNERVLLQDAIPVSIIDDDGDLLSYIVKF